MENSLFRKNQDEQPTARKAVNPFDLIEKEVEHLKHGTSVRHGKKAISSSPPWLILLALCGLAWLYLMDPFYHAWYKGEAVRAYLYLHNYGADSETANLVATQILSAEEIDVLNHRQGTFRDYYKSPEVASEKALGIIAYTNEVKALHAGKYQGLDPVGRMRYALFVKLGLVLPTDWTFLDPAVSN
jgi:hypothetical protein